MNREGDTALPLDSIPAGVSPPPVADLLEQDIQVPRVCCPYPLFLIRAAVVVEVEAGVGAVGRPELETRRPTWLFANQD